MATTQKKFIAPVLECTGELLPNVPNMTDFFKQLGSIPAVLTLQLSELPTCIALALWNDIKLFLLYSCQNCQPVSRLLYGMTSSLL